MNFNIVDISSKTNSKTTRAFSRYVREDLPCQAHEHGVELQLIVLSSILVGLQLRSQSSQSQAN